jgi:hypothetical protein
VVRETETHFVIKYLDPLVDETMTCMTRKCYTREVAEPVLPDEQDWF